MMIEELIVGTLILGAIVAFMFYYNTRSNSSSQMAEDSNRHQQLTDKSSGNSEDYSANFNDIRETFSAIPAPVLWFLNDSLVVPKLGDSSIVPEGEGADPSPQIDWPPPPPPAPAEI